MGNNAGEMDIFVDAIMDRLKERLGVVINYARTEEEYRGTGKVNVLKFGIGLVDLQRKNDMNGVRGALFFGGPAEIRIEVPVFTAQATYQNRG